MKAITNTDIIESRSTWARRIAPVTMLFLVAGLISNFLSINQPQYFRYTLILLALGFLFATVSSHLVSRWVREPRGDQVLTATLKKFGNDFILFNYTTSVPYILLTPSRLYVIVVKQQSGQITVNGQRFTQKFSWGRLLRLFADEGLGAPVSEGQANVKKLEKLLSKELADDELPEIKPIIIFANKEVELSVNNPPIPVMRSNELKTYLRENDKIRSISASQRKALVEIIGGEYQ